jgi:hypothetical protein
MTAENVLITQLYIGYFNRAPDPAGLSYWVGEMQSGISAVAIANSFAHQPEALAIYSYLNAPVAGSADGFVASIYENLFKRIPDAAGLAYWKAELAQGKPVGRIIVDIISGAQGADKTLIDNKVAAALNYVSHLGASGGDTFRIEDARHSVANIGGAAAPAAPADLAPQHLSASDSLTISISDATGALAPYDAAIRQSVSAAWDMWASHFTRAAPIEVEIIYRPSNPGVLASAGSTIEVFTGQTFDGRRITQSGVASELITGLDPNGAAVDARINLSVDPGRLVFRDSPDDAMPRDKLDALSIFAHEFGHVLGFRSALDSNGAPTQSFITNYDKLVTGLTANSLQFTGQNAVAAKGGNISLASSGPAHLGAAGDLMASSLGAGQTKLVGVLDLAVLQDLGLPVSLAAFDGFS